MRMIGHVVGEAQARAFSDYLLVQGIENEVESDKDGAWAVWIRAEEELARAKTLLAGYAENPADPKYRGTGSTAAEIKEQKQKDQAAYEKRIKQRRHLFRPLTGYAFGPVTFLLVFASVGIFLAWYYGNNPAAFDSLSISEKDIRGSQSLSTWQGFQKRVAAIHEILPEIRRGEVWRLFSPMLLHFGFIHIICDMYMLAVLGSMIEGRQRSWLLAVLVLVIAAGSNFAQYMVSGPGFGGMSGVNYGLMGYIWLRGKFDPGSGLFLHPQTVTMMIIWFFACMVPGLVGPIANTAHAAGLLLGMAWGFLSSLRHR